MRLLALAVIITAVSLRLWCQLILVRHGIESPLAHAMPYRPTTWATEGPYRYVRHPIYLLNLLTMAAVGAFAFGAAGVVLFLPALPYYQARMIVEDEFRRAA